MTFNVNPPPNSPPSDVRKTLTPDEKKNRAEFLKKFRQEHKRTLSLTAGIVKTETPAKTKKSEGIPIPPNPLDEDKRKDWSRRGEAAMAAFVKSRAPQELHRSARLCRRDSAARMFGNERRQGDREPVPSTGPRSISHSSFSARG